MCFGCSGELDNKIVENLPEGESRESMLSYLDGTFEEATMQLIRLRCDEAHFLFPALQKRKAGWCVLAGTIVISGL